MKKTIIILTTLLISGCDFTPKNRYMIVSDSNIIYRLDTITGEVVVKSHFDEKHRIYIPAEKK